MVIPEGKKPGDPYGVDLELSEGEAAGAQEQGWVVDHPRPRAEEEAEAELCRARAELRAAEAAEAALVLAASHEPEMARVPGAVAAQLVGPFGRGSSHPGWPFITWV